MKTCLWTAVFALLLPVVGLASARSPVGPRKPTAAERKTALDALRDVVKKRGEVQDAEGEWLKSRGRPDADKEVELDLYEKYLHATNSFDASAERALEIVRAIYRVDPRKVDGRIHAPGAVSSSIDWTKGTEIHWKPKVVVDEARYRRYESPSGELHYAGSDSLDAAATTDILDGTVEISYEEISLAITEKNPGLVASTLYHESIHFQELMTKGCDSREESELAAYNKEIEASALFKLPKSRLDEISNARDGFQRDFDAGVRTPFGIAQDVEEQMKAGFIAQESEQRELATYYDDLRTTVQQIRKERLEREQEEDRQRRAAEERARQVEEEKARVLEAALSAIRGCWFEPDYRQNGHVFTGFRAETNGWPSAYAIGHRMTLDQLKVGIMFARSCLSATVRQLPPDVAGMPCNEAFVIADQHWNEPGFKEDSRLDVIPEEQARCMEYIQDHWSVPMTLEKLRRIIPKARSEYERVVDDRWRRAEAERKEREAYERSQREAREDRDRERQNGGNSNGRQLPPPLRCGFDSSGAYCR